MNYDEHKDLQEQVRIMKLMEKVYHYFPYNRMFASCEEFENGIEFFVGESYHRDRNKPILRNYKNISKDIIFNGKILNPLEEIVKMITSAKSVERFDGTIRNVYYFKCEFEYGSNPQTLIMTENFDAWYAEFHENKPSNSLSDLHKIPLKLFEWSFDIPEFDLIKNGIAYDFDYVVSHIKNIDKYYPHCLSFYKQVVLDKDNPHYEINK